MIIKTNKNNIVFINKTKNLSFKLSDDVVFMSIKAFLDEKPKEDIGFKLSVESDDRRYIVFSSGYKLLINKITFFEMANRMILLNKKLVFPKLNIEEDSDER